MNSIRANIVDLYKAGKVVCTTTNGFVKKNGEGVMGAGNAKAISNYIPGLKFALGRHINVRGNVVGFIAERVIAFPVKPQSGTINELLTNCKIKFKKEELVPGFWCRADLKLIEKSMEQLNKLIETSNLEEVYLPVPGINNGQLSYTDVEPILKKGSSKIIFVSL